MEVALSRSDRCLSLLASCEDHIQNGRVKDAVKTVKVIRKEGRQFESAMNTFKRNLQASETTQKKQLDDYTDKEHRLQIKITAEEAKIKKYTDDVKKYERDVSKYAAKYREADNDWDRYHRAYREAEEKLDEFHRWWWVPIVGQILLVRELIQSNGEKMEEASRRKRDASKRMSSAEKNRDNAKSMVTQSKKKIKEAEREKEECKRGRDECHKKCTELRRQIGTISQGEKALSDILCLTESACRNTDELKTIFGKCDGSVRLLQARGTKMKMKHVGDSWSGVSNEVSLNRGLLRNRALTGAM